MIFSQDLIKKLVVLIIIFVTFFVLHVLTQNTLENFFTSSSSLTPIEKGVNAVVRVIYIYGIAEKKKSESLDDYNSYLNQKQLSSLSGPKYQDIKNICYLLNDPILKKSLIKIAPAADKNDLKTFSNGLSMIDSYFEGEAPAYPTTSGQRADIHTMWKQNPANRDKEAEVAAEPEETDFMNAHKKAAKLIEELYTISKGFEEVDPAMLKNYKNILWILNQPLLLQSAMNIVDPGEQSVINSALIRLRETYDNFSKTLYWPKLDEWTLDIPATVVVSGGGGGGEGSVADPGVSSGGSVTFTKKSYRYVPKREGYETYEGWPINNDEALSYTIYLNDNEPKTVMGYIESVVVKSDWHTKRPTKIKVMDSKLAWNAEESFDHNANMKYKCGPDGGGFCKRGEKSQLKVVCPAERKIPSEAVTVQIFKETVNGDSSSVVLHEIIVNYIVV